jgi:hypothetical protein
LYAATASDARAAELAARDVLASHAVSADVRLAQAIRETAGADAVVSIHKSIRVWRGLFAAAFPPGSMPAG